MRALNGRPIRYACAICIVNHAVIKEPRNKPEPVTNANLCDICEALGNNKVPQSVFDIKKFAGVRPESYHNGELIVFDNIEEV